VNNTPADDRTEEVNAYVHQTQIKHRRKTNGKAKE